MSKLGYVCCMFLADEQTWEEVETGAASQGGFGCAEEIMGKSNSKLKPEVVEELTRKTYCKYLQVFFTVARKSQWISNSQEHFVQIKNNIRYVTAVRNIIMIAAVFKSFFPPTVFDVVFMVNSPADWGVLGFYSSFALSTEQSNN